MEDGARSAIWASNYAKLHELTPALCDRIRPLVASSGEPGSVQHNLDPEGAANHAIIFAGFHLHAALDALELWHRASTSDVADMDVTVQGTAALLRQALECAAIASWLVGSDLLLAERGFAALWQNLDERIKCPDAAGYSHDPALDAQQVADLLAFGAKEGVLNETGDGPRKKIVGNTDACKKVPLDPARFGTANAEAFYRWASGMTHGLPWATTSEVEIVGLHVRTSPSGEVMPTGGNLVVPRPNYALLSTTLCAVHETVGLACSRLEVLKAAPH